VFSSANRLSKPISQERPKGVEVDGGKVNLMMGIRALGRGLTMKLDSVEVFQRFGGMISLKEKGRKNDLVESISPRLRPDQQRYVLMLEVQEPSTLNLWWFLGQRSKWTVWHLMGSRMLRRNLKLVLRNL
jgi:hypothetical protein